MSTEPITDPLDATIRSIFNAHADRLRRGMGSRPGIDGFADVREHQGFTRRGLHLTSAAGV